MAHKTVHEPPAATLAQSVVSYAAPWLSKAAQPTIAAHEGKDPVGCVAESMFWFYVRDHNSMESQCFSQETRMDEKQ